MHKLSKHEGTLFDCDQCVYKATQKRSLSNKSTKKSKHERIKSSCDQCDYKTSYNQALRIHKQSKHGDIKFEYEQCEYKATKKGHLRVHTLSKHGGHIWLWSMWIQSNHQKSSKSAYTIEA